MRLDPTFCRMVRAALDWSQRQLAANADLSPGVIRDFERGSSIPHRNNLTAIVAALQRAGVKLVAARDGRVVVLPPGPASMSVAAD